MSESNLNHEFFYVFISNDKQCYVLKPSLYPKKYTHKYFLWSFSFFCVNLSKKKKIKLELTEKTIAKFFLWDNLFLKIGNFREIEGLMEHY